MIEYKTCLYMPSPDIRHMTHKKIKILLLSNYFNDINDASFRVRYLTAKLLSERHDMDITLIGQTKERHIIKHAGNNMTEIYTPMLLPEKVSKGGFSVTDLAYKTWNTIWTGYDIVHVDMPQRPGAIIPALSAKWLHRSRIICEMWEWFGKGGISDNRKSPLQKMISIYDNLFELRSYGKYDAAIAITSVLKQRLSNRRIYDNTIVLHGGAEVANLIPYSLEEARTKLNLNMRQIVIGMTNLCSEDENDNNLFLDVFPKLADRHQNLSLMVTGKRDYVVESFLKNYPYKDRVIYPGWVDRETYNYYLSACNFFVLPLRDIPRNAGRWPNKIGDYFAVDRPVLTNRVGDLERIFSENEVGALCDANPDDIMQQANEWIASPQSLEAFYGKPIEFAKKELDFTVRIDRIAHFYRELLN